MLTKCSTKVKINKLWEKWNKMKKARSNYTERKPRPQSLLFRHKMVRILKIIMRMSIRAYL